MASAAMDMFLSKLDECDEKLGNPRREWTSRVTCMKQLEAAATELPSDSAVPAKAVQKISFMVDAFRVELTDCRPAVVKQTCTLLGTLAWTCGASFTSITDALLVPILLMATKKKQTQVIAMAARHCLHCMTKASRFAIVILEKTYQHAKQDENLRMMCTSLVVLVLRYWDADSVLSRDAYVPLRRFILKALGDDHTAVRTQARMALCLLCEYGHESPALLDTVDTETIALIVTEFPESLLASEQRRLQQRHVLLLEADQDDASLLSAIPEAHEDEVDEDGDDSSDDGSEDLSHVLILPKTYWHTPPPTAAGSQPARQSTISGQSSNNNAPEPWVDRLDWSQYSDTSSTKDEYVRERAASMEKPPSDRDPQGSSTIEDFEEESEDEQDAVPGSEDDDRFVMSEDEWNGSDIAVFDDETCLGDEICGAAGSEAVVSMQEWLQKNRDDDGVKLTPPEQTSGSTTASHTDSHDGSPCTDEPIGAAHVFQLHVEDVFDDEAVETHEIEATSKQDSFDVSHQNFDDVQIAGHHEEDLVSVHVMKPHEETTITPQETSPGTTPEPAMPLTSQLGPLSGQTTDSMPSLPPLLEIRPSRRRHSSAFPGGSVKQPGRSHGPTPPRSPTPPSHAPPASGYRSIRYATASFAPSPSPSSLQTDVPSNAATDPPVAFDAGPAITRTLPTQGGHQGGGHAGAVPSSRRNSAPLPLNTPPPPRDTPSRPSKRRPKPPISAAQVHSLESTLDSILHSMDKLSSQLPPVKQLKHHGAQPLVPTMSLLGPPQAHSIVAPPADSLPLPKLFDQATVHVPLEVPAEKATVSSTAELSPQRLDVAPVSPLKSRAPCERDTVWDALLSLVWVASLVFAVVGVATAVKAHNDHTLFVRSPNFTTKAQLVAEFDDAAARTTEHLARLERTVHDWNAAMHGAKRQLETEVWSADAAPTSTEWEAALSALRRQVADELDALACHEP